MSAEGLRESMVTDLKERVESMEEKYGLTLARSAHLSEFVDRELESVMKHSIAIDSLLAKHKKLKQTVISMKNNEEEISKTFVKTDSLSELAKKLDELKSSSKVKLSNLKKELVD